MSSLQDAIRIPRARPRWMGMASVGLLAVLLLATSAGAGDSDLAKFLLDAGRKDLEKKQYDDALTKLEKAAVEDPKLLEVRYWIAVAHDRKGDAPKAVAAYRAFRDACAAATPTPDKECAKLLKTTEARLAVLAAAETELQKMHDAFAAKALALAKVHFARDPTIATKALQHVLTVVPDHAEARGLLAKLTGAAPAPTKADIKDGGPYKDVAKWTDLLATQALTASGMSYENGVLFMDEKVKGNLYTPKTPFDSGKSFVYEIEYRLVTPHTDRWYIGLVFGETVLGTHLVTFAGATDLLFLNEVERVRTELADKPIPPVRPDEWHRLAVVVSGNRAEVFFDDKQVVVQEIPGREHLAGSIGLFHQRSRIEVRRWRIGARG